MADDSTSAWPRKSDIPCDASEYTDDTNPWDPDLDEGFGLNQFIGMIDPNEELHVVATVQAVPVSRSATSQKNDIETSTSQAAGAGDAQIGDAQIAALHAAIVARISARLSGLSAKQLSGDEEAENEKPFCAPTSDGTGLSSTKSSACDPMSAGSTQSSATLTSATLTASSSQRSSLQSSSNISAKKQSAKPQLLKKMKTLLQDVKEFARTATLLGH